MNKQNKPYDGIRGMGAGVVKCKGGQVHGDERCDFGMHYMQCNIQVMRHRIVPLKPI